MRVAAITLLLSAAFTASATAAPTLFGPATDYATGGTGGPGWAETNAAAADVDGDGKQDPLASNSYQLHVLLGKGDGTFKAPTSYSVIQGGQEDLQVADFNRDGKPDLAATDAGLQQILALRGDGTGGFTQFASVPTALVPGTVLTGDFDEDGYDDVAATNEFNGGVQNVTVALNNGSGGFGAAAYFDGGFGPVSGVVGDVDGDGNLDIVSSDTVRGL